MNGRQPLYVMAVHGVIALVVVLAATLLAYHGSLDAEAATAIFGAALGLAGGTASSLGSLNAAVNGKATITEATLAEREGTIRQALTASSATADAAVAANANPPGQSPPEEPGPHG